MAERVLPLSPGPVPAEDPVAVEAVVPPPEPAKPVEGVEVIAWVFCDVASVLRVLCRRFQLLGRLVLYLLVSV